MFVSLCLGGPFIHPNTCSVAFCHTFVAFHLLSTSSASNTSFSLCVTNRANSGFALGPGKGRHYLYVGSPTPVQVEGPCKVIRTDAILKALRIMKNGKATGPTVIVSEMFKADEDCSAEWLTCRCSLIVAQGRIPDDRQSSILLLVFKGKGDQWNVDCIER